MKKIKADHVIIKNQKIFCSHCGSEQVVPYPIKIHVFVAMCKAFLKIHLNCPKIWSEPLVNTNFSEVEKADFWLHYGERGSSSSFMHEVLSGRSKVYNGSIPYDPSDFKRCHGLLEMVPEWRNKLDLLKPASKTWSNLVDNWDKLTEMLKDQMLIGRANGMYEFMESLRGE